jgi:hypothetical protein
LFVVVLVMAPSSQELEPPANPGRFKLPELRNQQEAGSEGGQGVIRMEGIGPHVGIKAIVANKQAPALDDLLC